ncbi:MAG: hypothetical protein WBA57_15090 [Elainellaceae cyanobacterium]
MVVHKIGLKLFSIYPSDRPLPVSLWSVAQSRAARRRAIHGAIALTVTTLSCIALPEKAGAVSLTPVSSELSLEALGHQHGRSPSSSKPESTVLHPSLSPLLVSQSLNTEFPLPSSVRNFENMQGSGEAAINFQTDLNLNQAIAFYRQQLGRLGLTERSVNTAITDGTFSLIFDTWSNGKPVVVQGVSMGRSTNISLRLDNL